MAKYVFECIDGHTAGNPVRLVVKGAPNLQSGDMASRRQEFLRDFDWVRMGLMFEPRGHDLMSGSFLYPPANPIHDCGVLFIETSGCLPMCGHGLIGTVTFALEEGLVVPQSPGKLKIETPAGLIQVEYKREGEKVTAVKLISVPSFLHSQGLEVVCEGLGKITVDVAYGGNFYAIVDEQEHFLGMDHYGVDQLIIWSRAIRQQLNEHYSFEHPLDPEISGLSHVLWSGVPKERGSTARNAVFYGEKAIDRSPCGTGTSARMAQWYAKGQLKEGDTFVHESIISSVFEGTIEGVTQVGDFQAIIPGISGQARITGYNRIILDDDDPFVKGFTVK